MTEPQSAADLTSETGWAKVDYNGHILCHLAFIHLPDPRLDPLPVFLAILGARGERDTQLRTLTMVNEPARSGLRSSRSLGPTGLVPGFG